MATRLGMQSVRLVTHHCKLSQGDEIHIRVGTGY